VGRATKGGVKESILEIKIKNSDPIQSETKKAHNLKERFAAAKNQITNRGGSVMQETVSLPKEEKSLVQSRGGGAERLED